MLLLASALPAWGQGVWERRANYPIEASAVSATTVYGQRLYGVCGSTASGSLNSLFIYDPVVDAWKTGASLPINGGADHCNVGASGGKLYVVGALRAGTSFVDGNTYEYDPAENHWQTVARMPTPRGASAVVVIGTRIYVAGGLAADGKSLKAFEVFDTTTRRWTRLPDMPTARDHLTARSIKGAIYAIGGQADRALSVVEQYNPSTRAWRTMASIPTARAGMASGKINSRIQVFGGEGSSTTPEGTCGQNEEYDPATDTWRSLTPMLTARQGLGGVTIGGRIFAVAGGLKAGAGFSNVHEAFYLPLAAPPSIAEGGTLNAASLNAGISSGALVSLFGDQLSQGEQRTTRYPLPTQMNAVMVKLNGKPVPLVYVGPSQINFQIPYDFPAGPTELVVVNAGLESAKTSLPSLSRNSPGIFTLPESGYGQGMIFIAGTGLIAGARKSTGFRQAHKGDVIEIYCTGLGPLINPPAMGLAAPSSPAVATVDKPIVTIGGVQAEILFSGLAPGLVGVYQINARIPANAEASAMVPVTIQMAPNGPLSNEVTMAILD